VVLAQNKSLQELAEKLKAQPFEITEEDKDSYFKVISTDLTEAQEKELQTPPQVYHRQESVLAVHWHPEFVPMDVIRKRIDNTFPNKELELIIPTQHNIVMSYGSFSGVEVDCYDKDFNRKVQLLLHFNRDNIEKSSVLTDMLAHTFKYRSSQLFELINAIISPNLEFRLQQAATETGASEDLIEFVRFYTRKVEKMIEQYYADTPEEAIKNKLLRNYFDTLRDKYDDRLINRAQFLIKEVKKLVKLNFDLSYFYESREIIEEARSIGAGIIVPHPEQFWPILLANYDVDGYEVWNPQSREFTEFLIQVVINQNKTRRRSERQLLVFMGDDCHMGEKVKEKRYQDPEKAGREIGVQPAWNDLLVNKRLILAGMSRENSIIEYRNRLQ
jgi:hypothetical protein